MDINNKIRKLRFELNLTQQEFADRIGISRPSLSCLLYTSDAADEVQLV